MFLGFCNFYLIILLMLIYYEKKNFLFSDLRYFNRI